MSLAGARISIEPFGGPGQREMVALRHAVLRAPLGLAFDDAALAAEAGQLHLALRLDGAVVGTLLLVPPPGGCGPDRAGRLRQMAVAPALQGRGLGRLLVREGERALRSRGASGGWLHARETAVGFYRALGYAAEGDPFEEIGLPHRLMRRTYRTGEP